MVLHIDNKVSQLKKFFFFFFFFLEGGIYLHMRTYVSQVGIVTIHESSQFVNKIYLSVIRQNYLC